EAAASAPRLTHDHAEWHFDSCRLLYHDPRRFGCILWHDAHLGDAATHHPLLRRLGREPLELGFDGKWLKYQLTGKRPAIKQARMDASPVVGVGNIYASEALFLAHINPRVAAGRLSLQRCNRLVQAVRNTLRAA